MVAERTFGTNGVAQPPGTAVRAVERLVLLVVFVLALVVRLGIGDRPLWHDEAATWAEARGSLPSERAVSFSPLPALLVRALPPSWDEPWRLRLPFAVSGSLAILLMTISMLRLDGCFWAAVSGAVLALSPFHVLYSSEMRMYSIVFFATGAGFACLVRALEDDDLHWWIGYAVAGVLAAWAHPFTTLLVLAHGGYLMTRRRRLLRSWLGSAITVGVGAVAAVVYGVLIHGVGSDRLGWIESRPLLALPATLYAFILGNTFVPSILWLGASLLGTVLVSGLALWGVRSSRPLGGLLAWSLVAPVSLVLAASALVDLYNEQSTRYLAFAQPFLLILAVRGAARLRDRRLQVTSLSMVAVILTVGLVPLYFFWDTAGMGAFDTAAELLSAEVGSRDAVLVAPLAMLPLSYHLRDEKVDLLVTRGSLIPEEAVGADKIWMVELQDRPMLLRVLGSEDAETPPSPELPDYVLEWRTVLHGRKPLVISRFRRLP